MKHPRKSGTNRSANQKIPLQVFRLEINVKPGHARTCLRREERGWILGIREPARDGLANRGVVRALSDFLGVSVSSVSIVRGEGSRVKMIEISGLDREEGLKRLERALSGPDP
jgi:uncharacterized protein YggU (UPF0235/DUF167 family)